MTITKSVPNAISRGKIDGKTKADGAAEDWSWIKEEDPARREDMLKHPADESNVRDVMINAICAMSCGVEV